MSLNARSSAARTSALSCANVSAGHGLSTAGTEVWALRGIGLLIHFTDIGLSDLIGDRHWVGLALVFA